MTLASDMNTTQKVVVYFGVSLASSFAFAFGFVVVMTLTLPETDMAHGQMPFQDPLVLPIMSMMATASAVVSWPFYTILGWRLPPFRVGVVAGAATLAFILMATPIHPSLGWPGSYAALLAALIVCKLTMKEDGQQKAGELFQTGA